MSWKVLALSVPNSIASSMENPLEQSAEELNAQCLGFSSSCPVAKTDWLAYGPSAPVSIESVLA
jgi:hypothetical protein